MWSDLEMLVMALCSAGIGLVIGTELGVKVKSTRPRKGNIKCSDITGTNDLRYHSHKIK